MTTREDPLLDAFNPEQQPLAGPMDRAHYATGMLLDALDFQTEQTYHRGRLARALRYLHGYGTVAGLAVTHDLGTAEEPEELAVEPGLAIDRLGRLIELPQAVCIRLNNWYEQQDVDDLRLALYTNTFEGVFVDVFIRFIVCEFGKTPAFPDGPFDAIDAAQPSRLRDAYQVSLALRSVVMSSDPTPVEVPPPLPANPWQAVADAGEDTARRDALQAAILAAWQEGTEDWDEDGPEPGGEHVDGQDPTAVFLARVFIPATDAGPDQRPDRNLTTPVTVSYNGRPFALTPAALASWLGVTAV
jgi:hypothetical protein